MVFETQESKNEVLKLFNKRQKKYKVNNPLRGKLLFQKKRQPSSNHVFTIEATFEYIYLHLILSSFLHDEDIKRLNSYHFLFMYLCKIIRNIKLDYIYN